MNNPTQDFTQRIETLKAMTAEEGWGDDRGVAIPHHFWDHLMSEFVVPMIEKLNLEPSVIPGDLGDVTVAFDNDTGHIEFNFLQDGRLRTFHTRKGVGPEVHEHESVNKGAVLEELLVFLSSS